MRLLEEIDLRARLSQLHDERKKLQKILKLHIDRYFIKSAKIEREINIIQEKLNG